MGNSSRALRPSLAALSTRGRAAIAARLMHIHPLITKADDLAKLVDRLSKHPFIAVDTEFMRENTYWPELCLLQVASTEEAAAIDPQADLDLAPILDLMVENREVLKVFHAGGQDLEIVHNLTGKTPHPLFDTQIAAICVSNSGTGTLPVRLWTISKSCPPA